MNKKANAFIITGLLLLAAALCLTAYNLRSDAAAGKEAADVLEQLRPVIPQHADQAQQPTQSEQPQEPAEEIPDYILDPSREMPTESINGVDYIGVISIPALELELPVVSEWSYPALKLAPCRYSGSAYSGGLVICAHNFASHFGGLKSLHVGDSVIFTDVDGNVFEYMAVSMETLAPTAVDDMKDDGWALSLFTCTIGGGSRVTVRCEAAAD